MIVPNSHEEMHLAKADIFLHREKDISKCKKDEWKAFHNTKNITYNDVYITFTTMNGEPKYFDLTEWYIEIYTDQNPEKKEEAPKSGQITFFDLLEE